MTSLVTPICYSCTHLHADADASVCDAYPDGIPVEILLSEVDHHQPHPGDHGTQFEQDLALPHPQSVFG